MLIIVVSFRAFDRPQVEAFVNKTFAEIHTNLFTRCNTYVPTSILEVNANGNYLPLNNLTDLQK